jgi:hypothetical protein
MNKFFIVWDSFSGAYDGAYRLMVDAEESLVEMKKRYPSKHWCIVQMVQNSESRSLADEHFHTHVHWTDAVDQETGEKYKFKIGKNNSINQLIKVN